MGINSQERSIESEKEKNPEHSNAIKPEKAKKIQNRDQ